VVVAGADATLAAAAEDALRARLREADVRVLGGGAFVVYGGPSASDVRDWLAPLLPPEGPLLVAEFERWSSFGSGVDTRWLLRRGH
jgi:hypothetical protein